MANFFSYYFKLLFIILAVCMLGCNVENPSSKSIDKTYRRITGKTMGTTYNITYQDQSGEDLKPKIDQLLIEINMDVSVYEKDAFISQFNRSIDSIDLGAIKSVPDNHHFYINLEASKSVYKKTNGYFDPTVMPLVNYWGFGNEPRTINAVDSVKIKTLTNYVGFDKITILSSDGRRYLKKSHPKCQLDFGAIAKGYGVGAVANLLRKEGVVNYMVEIGGEVQCKGQNSRGEKWTLAINTPKADASIYDAQAIIALSENGLATSGNYRNFYKMDGKKYSHTINPRTGFPEVNDLLSATVIAPSCMIADAYATAFMTMGLEKALILASKEENMEAYFIYGNESGEMDVKYTTGFKQFLIE